MPKLDIRVDLGVFISMQVCIRPLIWSIVNPLFNSVLSLILCLLLNWLLYKIILYILGFFKRFFFSVNKEFILDLMVYILFKPIILDSKLYMVRGNVYWDLRKASEFNSKATYYFEKHRKFSELSRKLNMIAPIFDRQGNHGLHDSLTDTARTLEAQGLVALDKAMHFQQQLISLITL